MIGEQLVDYVIESYEFTPTRGARVKRIVMRGIDKLGLTDADAQCQYADRVAFAFKIGVYGSASLDARLPQCDCVGSYFFGQVSLFDDYLRDVGNYPVQIRDRFREVLNMFGRDGKIVLPARTIVAVRFDPLSIRFERRNYNGDPMAFFQEHRARYGELSRTELARFDSGLYDALRECGQLDMAVPKKLTRALPESEQRKIADRFSKNSGGVREVSSQLGRSVSTVSKYAGKFGLEDHRRNKTLSDDKRKKIIDSYDECKRNAHAAARRFGCSDNTVARHWARAGLKALGIKGRCLSADQIKEICDAYASYNGSVRAAALGLHYSREVISKYWKEAYLM